MITLPLGLRRIAGQNKLQLFSLTLLVGLVIVQANCSAFARNRKIKLNETFTM